MVMAVAAVVAVAAVAVEVVVSCRGWLGLLCRCWLGGSVITLEGRLALK